ncbi:MAG: hypothetical protein ACPGVB_16100, partial [Chitinophagales bacterium]
NYFGNEMEVKAIQKFLYEHKFKPSDAEYVDLEEVKSKEIYQYSLVKYLVEKEDKATLDYMLYAKEVEKALEIGGAWTNDELAKPTLQKLIDLAKNSYPESNPTLQLRYGYQMVVLARYLEDYKQAVVLYEEFLKPLQSKSIVKYWGMMHRATALYHINQKAAADYNFAMAFKNAPNKRHRAYQGFEGKDMEASLVFVENQKERAALWLMKGIKSPGRALESINNVYSLAPKMPELELLLTREINKLEDWLLTPIYTGFDAASSHLYYEDKEKENQENDRKYLERIASLVDKVIQEKKVNNPVFWQVAAAYLAFMQENYLKSNTHLQQAEMAEGANEAIQNQIHLTRIMAFANDYGGISKEAEEQLLTSLQWLEKQSPNQQKENEYGYTSLSTYGKVMYALARRYEKNEELHKAAMYLSQVKGLLRAPTKEFIYSTYRDYFYYLNEKASPKDLGNMLELFDKKDKTSYEQFLTKRAAKDKNKILDLLGTMYLRQDKLKESLAVFEQIPTKHWGSETFMYDFYLDANPFYANFYNGHQATIGDTIRYTKPEFVAEMLSMKAIAADGGLDEAYCNLLIANGYFNMTFYGNSWMLTRYWATSGWEYGLNNAGGKNYGDIANFYGCTRAKVQYEKAAETASTCSFAALCYRMAGKCDYRQEFFEKMLVAENSWDVEAPQFKDNYYYNLLHSNFSEYYDKLIEDCTSIDDFVAWGD